MYLLCQLYKMNLEFMTGSNKHKICHTNGHTNGHNVHTTQR